MKNILVINNNPNNSEGIYTPILINNIKINHKVYECRNIKDLNELINNKININLIITCGSSVNLTENINISEHINKTTLAMFSFPEVPIVGICFGMQLLCVLYGSSLYKKKKIKL